jgi:hypothetical protein
MQKEKNMAGNKQWDRLAKIIKNAEKGLESGIKSLQQNIKALTAGGIGPPKPKKDLVRALQRLRKALNKAILSLEHRLGSGTPARKKRSRRSAA